MIKVNGILFIFFLVSIQLGCVSNRLKYRRDLLDAKIRQVNDVSSVLDTSLLYGFSKYVKEFKNKKSNELIGDRSGRWSMKISDNIFFYGNTYYYTVDEYSNKGQLQKQWNFWYIDDKISDEITLTQRIDRLFDYKEIYYSNGQIKKKAIFCNKGFYVSKAYSFDIYGNLIGIDDYDAGFEFTFDDVFKFCNRERLLDKSEKKKPPFGQKLSISKTLNGTWGIGIWSSGSFLFTLSPSSGNVLSVQLMQHAQPAKEIPIKLNKKKVEYISREAWYP